MHLQKEAYHWSMMVNDFTADFYIFRAHYFFQKHVLIFVFNFSASSRTKKHYPCNLAKYENEAIVIQKAWRGYKARRSWEEMLRGGSVDLDTVISHLHLLDIRDQDFREELDLQSLRGELSKLIRQNEQLEAELDQMDVDKSLTLVHSKLVRVYSEPKY